MCRRIKHRFEQFSKASMLHQPMIKWVGVGFAALLLLFYCPIGGFSVRLMSLQNAIDTVEAILRSVVILLGIIITILVISFQTFNKYFGRLAFKVFFRLTPLRALFTGFLLNILFSIYVLIYLKDCKTLNDFDIYAKFIFIVQVAASLILVCSIFPTLIKLLSISQSRSNISNFFSEIDHDDLGSYFPNAMRFGSESGDSNNIKLIRDVAMQAIKEFDEETFDIILDNLLNHFEAYLKSENDRESKQRLYRIYSDFLWILFQFAIKEKNTSGSNSICAIRGFIEVILLESPTDIVHDHNEHYMGWDYLKVLEWMFDKASASNEDSICDRLIGNLRDYYTLHIEKRFPGNFEFNNENPYLNNYEPNPTFQILNLVNKFSDNVIDKNKLESIKEIGNLFDTIDIVTIGSKNTFNTKRWIISRINDSKERYLKKTLDTGKLNPLPYTLFPFNNAEKAVKSVPTQIILKAKTEAIRMLFRKGAVSNGIFNSLKSDMMLLADLYDHAPELAISAFTYCLKFIASLEPLVNANSSERMKDQYLQMVRYLSYVENDFNNNKIVKEGELNKLLKDTVASFTRAPTFDADLKKSGYVQDNNLI